MSETQVLWKAFSQAASNMQQKLKTVKMLQQKTLVGGGGKGHFMSCHIFDISFKIQRQFVSS